MKIYEKPILQREEILLDDVIAASTVSKSFGSVNDNSMDLDFSDFHI